MQGAWGQTPPPITELYVGTFFYRRTARTGSLKRWATALPALLVKQANM